MPDGPVRIAMWSGPRNISTAMMRAWENRPDTIVCDEPLYAHYLAATGLDHPGAADVVREGETDWGKAVDALIGPVPGGHAIYYQKHMAHHLLPGIDRAWIDALSNAFLIRDPAEMIVSLGEFLPEPTLRDTGLPQQVEIFDRVRAAGGRIPPVVDARDVMDDPERMLRRLCEELDVRFLPAMLSWPPGPRSTDGVWGRHWYASVERSTGFRSHHPKNAPLPAALEPLLVQCRPHYDHLHGHRLT